MNIAVDVQPLISPMYKNRGIGNYNIDQLKLLITYDKHNNYIFFNAYNDESVYEVLNINPDRYKNVKNVNIYTGYSQYLIQSEPKGKLKKYNLIMGEIVKSFLKKNEIDLFYFTSPFDYWDIYNIDWFKSVSTIGTVYDVIPFLFSDKYLTDLDEEKSYMRSIELVKKLDRIVVISQSVKNDLIKYIGISEEKIDVINAGIDKRFRKLENISDELEIKDKYGINGEFIMCTGGADSRKNMNELIIAYSKLPDEIKAKYILVIVCELYQGFENGLNRIAEKYGVKDKIVMTNYVPFDHLLKLYNMASIMAFPSQYEGFGLPVIEAMACGTSVVTSNNSSLKEIAEGAAYLVNPFDIESISDGLRGALNDEDVNRFRDEMLKRVQMYTWENTVKHTMDSIKKIKYIKDNNLEDDTGIIPEKMIKDIVKNEINQAKDKDTEIYKIARTLSSIKVESNLKI